MSSRTFDPRARLFLPLALILPIAAGCPTEEDPDDGPPPVVEWEEGRDDENEEPWEAENVDVEWDDTLLIHGSTTRCEYNNAEDWSWTGDNDNYEVEVPADGFLDATLDWDMDADLDLIIWINPRFGGAGGVSPDAQATTNRDSGPESWVPDDPLESGDDVVFTVVCGGGDEGDYTLEIHWED